LVGITAVGISLLSGNGDGTFLSSIYYDAGQYPWSTAIGDFNGDGRPDLAVANWGSGNVSVLLGNGDGTFQPHGNYVTRAGPISVAVADFNGDLKLDLVVTDQGPPGGAIYTNANVSVLLGRC